MTSKPSRGYTEPHALTVFATWAKSPFTWDYARHRPLTFTSNDAALRANYCYRRRLLRRVRHRKWESRFRMRYIDRRAMFCAPVISLSKNAFK